MYYSSIGLLALLILIIENYDILAKRRDTTDMPAMNVYRRFLYAVAAYYVVDALWGILESEKQSTLLFADTTVYFVMISVGILFWGQYTVIYLEEKTSSGKAIVFGARAVAGAITALTVVNIFVPVLFTVDEYCVYDPLPVRYVVLAIQILLFLLISLYAFVLMRRRPAEKKNRCRTLSLFGLIMAAFLFVQIWMPYSPVYSVAYLLGTCLLHTFVVDDEKDEYARDLEKAEEIKELKDTIISLLDNMPCLTFTKDAKTGVYLACNQPFAEYARKADPSGVVGLTDAQIFDEVTAKHFVEDDKLALSMDAPYVFFEDVPDAAGDQRQFQTTKLKYTDSSGRLCLLGMCEDVTDIVRVQREHATTKEAYEKMRNSGIMYTHIAQVLARGYTDLYYVNLETEEYVEYYTGGKSGAFTEVRRDGHFFDECKVEAEWYIHPDDRAAVVKALERETLLEALKQNNTFIMTYRLLVDGKYLYSTMRASRMEDDDRFMVIGVSDVDDQVKHRRAAERIKEEKIAYARLNALAGDYLCVYVVVPETGVYREFSAAAGYESFALAKEGEDFFSATRDEARKYNHPDDIDRFLSAFTKENVMDEIAKSGIFAIRYRVMMGGKPVHVRLKAATVEEKEGTRLIVGLINVDAQVREEEEYGKRLAEAQSQANIDALTGIKNRHAYLNAEEKLDRLIAEDCKPAFAVTILDVNDLKKINDTEGHQAGDQCLRDACRVVCEIFEHSPVFRVGGDEFAVISQGSDFAHIDELIEKVDAYNIEAYRTGGVVLARGMALFEDDPSVAPVFERADQRMYENKAKLKEENK